MAKSQKKSVKESWYVFTIIMLVVAIGLLVYLFLQNPFITNAPSSSGLTPVGTPIMIEVNENSSASRPLFFHGSVLPNFEVRQDVNVLLSASSAPAVVRGKVFMYDEFGKIIPITAKTASSWVQKADGYYYSSDVLVPNLTLDFLEGFITPSSDYNLNSSNLYALVISFETLPENSNFEEIWKI